MIGVMLLAIILRYVLHLSPIWTAELARFLFVWTMLWALPSWLERENRIEIFREQGTPLMKIIFSLVSRGSPLLSIFILEELLGPDLDGSGVFGYAFSNGIVYAVI